MKYRQNWTVRRYDPEGREEYEAFEAEVPGNIQYDYIKHIGLEDYMYSNRLKALEETETWHWMYKTVLDFERKEGEKVRFVSEGTDYKYDIRLDGEVLFEGEGMYTPAVIDITDRAKKGSVLEVHVFPHPNRGGKYREYREAADECCKPPVTYGWDWNPRLLISGLWLDAYAETLPLEYIESAELFYTLSDDLKEAHVHIDAVCRGKVKYTLEDAEGRKVYEGESPDFTVRDVNLWWCAGQGEPYLYKWTAESAADRKEGCAGFRTLRLIKNEGLLPEPYGFPKSRYGAPMQVELNGKKIFAAGSNYVNPELFFGKITREKYRTQVLLAKDCGMNLFRIWGGAGMCREEFYEECDRAGIMVWQEFMLACNNYKDKPHYLSVLEREASSIIKRLRGHACLLLWCGGNELFNGWSGMDDQSRALRLLNKLCFELDENRPFLATSPLTGVAHGGYLFRYEDGRDVRQVFNESHFTAYCEFGVPSLSTLENLKKIIPEEEMFPAEDTVSWRYHFGFGAWGDNRWLCKDILEYYFGAPKSIDDMITQSGILQREGYKAIFEEARRQMPYCSMAINWCFNEPWITAANNALLEYPDKPKTGYFGVRDALRPVLASARLEKFDYAPGEAVSAEIWLLNNSDADVEETIKVFALTEGEERFLGEVTVNAEPGKNTKSETFSFVPSTSGLLTVRLETSDGNRGSEYTVLVRSAELR